MHKRLHKSNKFRSSAARWLLLAFAVHFFASWGLLVHQANHHTDFSGHNTSHLECHHSSVANEKNVLAQSYSENDHSEHCFFCYLDWLSPSVYDIAPFTEVAFSSEILHSDCAALCLGHPSLHSPLGRAPPMKA